MTQRSWTRMVLTLVLLTNLILEPLWAETRPLEELSQQINEILYRPRYRALSWGIQVVDPTQDEILFTKNADRLFVPASNTKLFTTATAFVKLGPDFRFKTNAYITQPAAEGVVDGDLILEGRGAFTFTNMLHRAYSPTGILTDLAIQISGHGI